MMFIKGSTKIRHAAVAGQFYPQEKDVLADAVKSLLKDANNAPMAGEIRALIVPHAGYIYSGKVAARAYSLLDGSAKYKNIFIIGSSHHTSFEGASIYAGDAYQTPLGNVRINKKTVAQLLSNCDCFDYYEHAHSKEHSIEVQLPFLQTILNVKSPIVPIIIGTSNPAICKNIATSLNSYFNGDNLFIVSTDLSHYPAYKDAIREDAETSKSLIKNDVNLFLDTRQSIINRHITNLSTPMCGWTSVLTLLYILKSKPVKIRQIHYQNSGDVKPFGNKEMVVGYGSYVVINNS